MSRRGLLVALVVSLAVNLFLLGGLAGAALMGLAHHRPPAPGPGRMHAIGRALGADRQQAWETAVRGAVQTARPQLRQARDLRRQAWGELASDPANPQAAMAALDQSRALESQARGIMDRAVVAFAAGLPARDRAKLAQALARHAPGPPHPHRWSRRSDPAPGPHGPPLPER
jgi:uncharacterized membrane protein